MCRSSRWTGEQQSEAEEHSLCSPCCLSACVFCLSACLPTFLSVCLPVGLFGKCFLKLSDALPLPPKLTSSPQPHPFYLLITSTFSSLSYFDLQATSCGFFCSVPFSHFFSTIPRQHQLQLSALPTTSTAHAVSGDFVDHLPLPTSVFSLSLPSLILSPLAASSPDVMAHAITRTRHYSK